ncbi:unnamed protein product, partial [Amoebophrya sp. A25]
AEKDRLHNLHEVMSEEQPRCLYFDIDCKDVSRRAEHDALMLQLATVVYRTLGIEDVILERAMAKKKHAESRVLNGGGGHGSAGDRTRTNCSSSGFDGVGDRESGLLASSGVVEVGGGGILTRTNGHADPGGGAISSSSDRRPAFSAVPVRNENDTVLQHVDNVVAPVVMETSSSSKIDDSHNLQSQSSASSSPSNGPDKCSLAHESKAVSSSTTTAERSCDETLRAAEVSGYKAPHASLPNSDDSAADDVKSSSLEHQSTNFEATSMSPDDRGGNGPQGKTAIEEVDREVHSTTLSQEEADRIRRKGCVVLTSQDPKKYSVHVVFPQIQFDSRDAQKDYMILLQYAMPPSLSDIVDLQVYSCFQLYRTAFAAKICTETGKLRPDTQLIPQNYFEDDEATAYPTYVNRLYRIPLRPAEELRTLPCNEEMRERIRERELQLQKSF